MIDEDLYDVSLVKSFNLEHEFDDAMDNGNYEKARQAIDKMAEIDSPVVKARVQGLKEELLDQPIMYFKN